MEFRLLVPQAVELGDVNSSTRTNDTVPGEPVNTISINGRSWTLSHALDNHSDIIPDYTCISYRWDLERQEHALFPNKLMSTRVLPTIATAMKVKSDHSAFWTDVFCVPPNGGPARQATLENMGYIYAHAAEVVVVLGKDTSTVLEDAIQHAVLSEENLRVLELDQWVCSVWTYQELVNAADLRFVSEQDLDTNVSPASNTDAVVSSVPPSISGSELLNALGHGLVKYQQSHGQDSFVVTGTFPNLNILETMLADWMIGSYTRYLALTIFSNLYYKRNETVANYYYSILNALSDDARQLTWSFDQTDEALAERIMKICEQKCDFSFVYSVADRDTNSRRKWRPRATSSPQDAEGVPSIFRPIVAWHFYGEAQHGTFDGDGALTLHNMTIMRCAPTPAHMSDRARVALKRWLGRQDLSAAADDDDNVDTALPNLVYIGLQNIGFKGEANPIITSDGLVFTLNSINQDDIVDMIISNQIRFTRGAPGLVRYREHSDGETKYSPCLFVGAIDQLLEAGTSVLL